MDYTILIAKDPSELSSQVNNLIKQGWEPQGGVTLSQTHDAELNEVMETWAQAMTKRADQQLKGLINEAFGSAERTE